MNQFYGQFNPPLDQVLFERYFSDKNIKGFFIECGAYDGLVESSCKFFEETMKWNGINIEPVPSNYESLIVNRPNTRNLKLGLSNQIGQVSFKHAISPILGTKFGNGSIAHTPEHHQSLVERGCTFEEIQIETLTWCELIKREQIEHVDLFVLDVEGHEFAVLDGMEGCSVLPDIICIEIGHLDFYKIKQRLISLGYTYDTSSFVNAFFIRNEKIDLFAMRRLDCIENKVKEISVFQNMVINLENENRYLKENIAILQNIQEDIVNSKSWRLVELIRKTKQKFKRLIPIVSTQ